MKSKKLNLLKAFCSLTGAKTEKKITLATLRKDTSKWSQVGELRIFNLPKRPTIKECDARTSYYNNFVDPKEFSAQELENIGDLDIADDNLGFELHGMRGSIIIIYRVFIIFIVVILKHLGLLLEDLKKSSASKFKDSLLFNVFLQLVNIELKS